MSEGNPVDEDVCMVSVIEHPPILEYSRFRGEILYPDSKDLELALDIQRRLRARGMMKPAADLIIAATCINEGETLVTSDTDFEDISKASELKVVWE